VTDIVDKFVAPVYILITLRKFYTHTASSILVIIIMSGSFTSF